VIGGGSDEAAISGGAMIVAGGGKGVVLECDTPIMVKWPDGTFVVLHEDKNVILYDPERAELDKVMQQADEIRRLLEAGSR
jgi:hypothetical protein